MHHKIHLWFTIVFCVGLLGVGIYNVIKPANAFSQTENRQLAQAPELNLQTILSGEFMKSFETYSTDQFVGRDAFVSLKARCERLLGKAENNGVYFADHDYLIEKQAPLDERTLTNNLNALSKVDALKKYNLSFLLIPTSYEINQSYLPANAYQPVQQDILSFTREKLADTDVTLIDPTPALTAHQDEYLYYRTDHHQTSLGSYYVYQYYCEQMGLTPLSLDDFDRQTLSDSFYGSTWSKSMLSMPPDTVEAFIPKQPASYHVDYLDENRQSDSLYEMDNLNIKDKYTVFLDGNHAQIRIDGAVKNGKKLAVLKDSYAHSLLPFLANHYEEIHVFDLRYYNYNVLDYLDEQGITDVLAIYNVSNFNTDVNMVKFGAFVG